MGFYSNLKKSSTSEGHFCDTRPFLEGYWRLLHRHHHLVLYFQVNPHCLKASSEYNKDKDSPGGVISSKASLAHAGAIVTNKGSYVLVTHGGVESGKSVLRLTSMSICRILPM